MTRATLLTRLGSLEGAARDSEPVAPVPVIFAEIGETNEQAMTRMGVDPNNHGTVLMFVVKDARKPQEIQS